MPKSLSFQDNIVIERLLVGEQNLDKIDMISYHDLKKYVNENFYISIIKKRIEYFSLPIKFTELAYAAILLFIDRAGSAVTLLIDALNKYENMTVDVQAIINLYPFGFYTEEELIDKIDNQLKPKKIKWSEIY